MSPTQQVGKSQDERHGCRFISACKSRLTFTLLQASLQFGRRHHRFGAELAAEVAKAAPLVGKD